MNDDEEMTVGTLLAVFDEHLSLMSICAGSAVCVRERDATTPGMSQNS